MNEEEKKKMANLEKQVADLTKENGELKTSNTKLGEDIKERDTKITTLEENARERGQQFKRFKEMTDAEKELLSEKEKELMQRQDALEEEREKDRKDREEFNKKQKDATITNLANRLAKGDKDLAEQIKINLGKINPELLNNAQTEEELTPFVTDAFNMTGAGNTQGDSLRNAINTDGLPAKVDGEKDFADTSDGKQLGSMLGLKSFNNDNNNQ